jgi:hypothetical protein
VLAGASPRAASASTSTAYDSTLGAAQYAGEPNVFLSGTDGGLWQLSFAGSAWQGPAEIAGTGGSLASAPSAEEDGSSEGVYWRGSDSGLEEAWYDGSSWHGPGEVPGTAGSLKSAPSAMQGTSSSTSIGVTATGGWMRRGMRVLPGMAPVRFRGRRDR